MEQAVIRKLRILVWLAKVIIILSINTSVTLCLLYINGILNEAGFAFSLVLNNVTFLISLSVLLVIEEARP